MASIRTGPPQEAAGPTAFVLNISTAGLGAIRSLGRAGIPVVGLDPDQRHVGFRSRYCTARQCPHPVREPGQLVAFLLEQARALDEPGILSPASDAFVLFMSRHRDALKDHFRFILPSPGVVEASVDKRRLYELAQSVGVSHADTHYPATMEDIHCIKAELEYPVYIKPYHSHLWQMAFPGTGKGIKVFSAEELVSSFERIFPTGNEAMVQSIIAGPASNIRSVRVYIDQQGEVLAAFTNRKIRQFPTEFGRAVLAESIYDPALLAMGLKFFRDIGYRGFGLIEFKRDDRDQVLKVTDLNPRWLKTVNLATDAGIDFPLLHFRDLAGQSPPPQMEFRAGVRWLDAVGDIASSWALNRAGELSPWSWARSWAGVRSHAVFAGDDLGPFLQEYDYGRRLVRGPLNRLRRK
jgi:predicted ATP-grasp superfamily ATP-dependent carboligase